MTGEYLLRILVAAAIGAAIGTEREFRDKAAGLRTIMLIAIGSCFFTIMGQELITAERGDPTRIASALVSGVGFLGAGVIFRRGRRSTGITTAATIWCAAALGMGAGGGRFAITIASAAGILVVLWLLPPVERVIDNQRESKTYSIRTTLDAISVHELHELFDQNGLKVIDCRHGKKAGQLITELDTIGKHDCHTEMHQVLIDALWAEEFSS